MRSSGFMHMQQHRSEVDNARRTYIHAEQRRIFVHTYIRAKTKTRNSRVNALVCRPGWNRRGGRLKGYRCRSIDMALAG